jgi:alkylated DNA repair protein (DNA oxidative demethylase)
VGTRHGGNDVTLDLFGADDAPRRDEPLADGAMWLQGFALAHVEALLAGLAAVAAAAPLRHMITPGGHRMSVAMTNCGALGWTSTSAGYRYAPGDPQTGHPWPAMPDAFLALARAAAGRLGFDDYRPDCCLVNRYVPGARLSLHVDRDEEDAVSPIVSVSLGLPATFLWGGFTRSEPTRRLGLRHGDVVAWGGPSRMRYHGVLPLADGEHPRTGRARYNLTFRVVRRATL